MIGFTSKAYIIPKSMYTWAKYYWGFIIFSSHISNSLPSGVVPLSFSSQQASSNPANSQPAISGLIYLNYELSQDFLSKTRRHTGSEKLQKSTNFKIGVMGLLNNFLPSSSLITVEMAHRHNIIPFQWSCFSFSLNYLVMKLGMWLQ